MDTRYLQSFIHVAELGSIAEAARRLDLTPAAVAQRVRLLEEEMGMSLIRRSGRTVAPTEAGARILERGRKVLRDIRDLRDDLSDSSDLAGQLRVGGTPTMVLAVLPGLVSRFLGGHPQVDIYLEPGTSSTLFRKVVDGDLDAALLIQPLFELPKSCGWHTMREEPLVLLTPAGMQVDDVHATLEREPFLRYDRGTVGGQLADAYLRQHGIRTRQRCEMDGLDAIAALVERGIGVSLVPAWVAARGSQLAVRRWPLPHRSTKRVVGMIWTRTSARTRLVHSFLELVKDWRPEE
ncbi:LysR family transcriptional regulator [Herbaspirillum robiniae]|uniref:LysR family transcriptional regulator n=1 Tax=Herbaspirillum robiniae TaxID=2014887 RepID=A0ABX2M2F5_9BURK|nr:LysR family transcriptional regulator [Herbaspirillum robiniae]NUU02431.1 LysR family transcriptional regulator [Herbaspirillum robiniae]